VLITVAGSAVVMLLVTSAVKMKVWFTVMELVMNLVGVEFIAGVGAAIAPLLIELVWTIFIMSVATMTVTMNMPMTSERTAAMRTIIIKRGNSN
jgi:hypothetical protein